MEGVGVAVEVLVSLAEDTRGSPERGTGEHRAAWRDGCHHLNPDRDSKDDDAKNECVE